MFNLSAPIIPGKTAAGVRIGQQIEEVFNRLMPDAIVELHGCTRFQFQSVHLWVESTKIVQIKVYNDYRGCLQQGIGIGSTLREVQELLGTIAENEDDNLIVEGMTGWCFETEEWVAGRQPEQNSDARMSEIYVFDAAT